MSRIVSLWQRRARSGEPFERLLAPMIEPMFRLAWRLTGNAEDAEDLVQDLLVRVYPRRAELAELERLRPWLARVLFRLYLDRRRHAARSPHTVTAYDGEGNLAERSAGDVREQPEQQLEQSLAAGRLQRALNELPEEQRVVLLMHDAEGYTLPELEAVLETRLGTLKSRLHRGRERMRGLLATMDEVRNGTK